MKMIARVWLCLSVLYVAVMLLSAACYAQAGAIPQEPTIFVVTASWCAPCQRFRADWDNVPGLASLVSSQYAVKRCDWDKPFEQAWARRRGVEKIPSFVICYRGEVVECWSGYSGNWREFLQRVGLDDYVNENGTIGPIKPARSLQPESRGPPTTSEPQEPARAPAPQVNLQPIERQLQALQDGLKQLQQSATEQRERIKSPFADPDTAGPPVVSQPKPPEPSETPGTDAPGAASRWASLLSVVGKTAAVALFPEVALPAGAAGIALGVWRAWRSARGGAAQQPRQIVRQEIPIPVAIDSPPPVAQIVTQNQYIPVDTDKHADAYAWASAELVKRYNGASGTVAMLDSLIAQHKTAQGGTSGNK